MLRAHIARGMSTLTGSGAHLHSVSPVPTPIFPGVFVLLGVRTSRLDGDTETHRVRVPALVALPRRDAAASARDSRRKWTVRTELSKLT